MVPTHLGETKLEHSSYETNHHTNTIGRSHQRSYSQPAELCCRHLFVNNILDAPLSFGQKLMNINRYEKTINPDEHIKAYVTQVNMFTNDDSILYRLFLSSLKGPALTSWHQLPLESIDTFDTLIKHFGAQYATCRQHHITSVALIMSHYGTSCLVSLRLQ